MKESIKEALEGLPDKLISFWFPVGFTITMFTLLGIMALIIWT